MLSKRQCHYTSYDHYIYIMRLVHQLDNLTNSYRSKKIDKSGRLAEKTI